MSASGGRCRSGNRFYTPPPVRRQLLLQQQQLKQIENLDIQKEKDKQQRCQRAAPIQRTKSVAKSDNCASSTTATSTATTPPASIASPSVSDGGGNLSNLDRFLEHTTPVVPGQQFSKTSMRRCRAKEEEFQPYFVLGDLWESYHEWSAYGAGVPLLLNGSDCVVQYYVPYLSGIQLYIDPSMPTPRSRRLGEESDAESSRGSSGGSSHYESENGPNGFVQGVQSGQDLIEASRQGIKGLSLNIGSSSDEGESASFPGISILASRFPELRTYRSCDLSPGSWISVAWYPIYRIPMGQTLRNLDSCFLTFHSLSTPVHGTQNEWQCQNGAVPREVRQGFDMALKLSLPIFGLASLKFNASFWEQTGADLCQKANSLSRKADDWLQLLSVSHPDYRFFASHNYWR
ncbi:hypothetical protein V2J09_023094 [Rumex salicifolius]